MKGLSRKGPEEDAAPLIERILTQLSDPIAPWIAVIIGGLHYFTTGNPRPAVGTITIMVFLHFMSRLVLGMYLESRNDKVTIEWVSKPPDTCICGEEPRVYHDEDDNIYLVKCDNCLRKGGDSLSPDDAIAKWDSIVEKDKGKEDAE